MDFLLDCSCSFCGAVFGRRDHLRRHLMIHGQIRPFQCNLCARSFPRQDALGRHCRSVHGVQAEDNQVRITNTRKRIQSACQECRRQKQRCDGRNPCGRCRLRSSVCTYSRPAHPPSSQDISPIPSTLPPLVCDDNGPSIRQWYDRMAGPAEPPPAQSESPSDHTPSPWNSMIETPLDVSQPRSSSSSSKMLPWCAEFADLEIDFLMPSTNPPKSNHQLRQCQNTIKQGDDNEPTKSWLPHACLVRTSYDRLHAKLSEVVYHGSDTSIRVMLPSQDSLNSFIESYFENFSPLFPILSKAGFNADREHCLLVLSVCTIGVSFFGETQLQTLCLMRSLLRKHLDGIVGTETELATELWYQQVRFLAHVIFSCSESYEMLDYAQKAKGVFVMSQEQRLRGLDRESFKPDMTTWMQSEEELEAWRWRESVKRTIFAVWAVDTQGSLLYDLPPMVTLRARQLPLPAPEGLWEARTAKEWNAERLKQDIDQNPLSLDDWVEILYRDDDDDDIPVMTTLSSFSRFLAILAITQDIGEYVRASKKFARLHHKHTHEEETRITTSEWTALLTRCHDVLCQTPCFEESWPLHRQLISQAYHCTMMSMQVTYKDLYGFVGYKASSREVDVTRYRLSSWMLERPGGIQTALVHAVRILVHMRIDKPKNPHAALMVCIATLTIWVFLDLRLGSPSPSDEAMDMGRCPACRGDIRASLDRCCLKGTFGHDLSTFEIDLIRGTVSVERLVHESCDLLKTVTFWQISNGIISSLTYHYQLTKGSTNSARL